MKKKLLKTTKEALASVLPITAIVFLLSIFVSPMPVGTLMLFLCGAVLLVIGMGLFTIGSDMAMMPMGEDIGVAMIKSKKILLVGIVSFAMGVIITIAEPDLQVLAELVPGIPNTMLILVVASGVGIFLLLAILRILFRISLSKMLLACYAAVIVLSIFVPDSFIAVAFDSGGVTTGPITVPFILAMGLGLASIRSDRETSEDSFGLVALCSIGPILAVLILGICFRPEGTSYVAPAIPEVATSRDVAIEFAFRVPQYFLEVMAAVWPIFAVLLIFQIITRRYNKHQFLRVTVGLVYTFIGLVLFMTGINVGFIPVGQSLGADISASPLRWLLVPLGAIIGYFIVAAEPAVYVLKKQIEEVSLGAISNKSVQRFLSIGVAGALSIAMLRVLTGLSVYWFLVPGYITAIVLTFFVPKIFVGLAFDSGGVVSGPMTSTFLLPFAIGACPDPGRIMTDAFGLVAMVAMAPLLTIQIMGIVYKGKMSINREIDLKSDQNDDIIEFEEKELL